MHALERLGRRLGDRLAGRHRPGERHHRHVRVGDERDACRLALPAHDVEHAGRQDVGRQLGQAQRGVGRELGRLQHDGVPDGQRRRHLPGGHVERVVPRRDRPDHAERLPPEHRRVARHVLAGGAALEEAARRREELPVVEREVHLELHDRDGLADVLRLDRREVLDVALDAAGQLVDGLAALARRLGRPLREGPTGGRHGVVDVGGVRRRRGADHGAGRRVDDVVGGAAAGRAPLVVDEVLVLHGGLRGAERGSERGERAIRSRVWQNRADPVVGTVPDDGFHTRLEAIR